MRPGNSSWSQPGRLHETVRQQVDRLSNQTALMLRVAALIGVTFTFDELKQRLPVDLPQQEVALLRCARGSAGWHAQLGGRSDLLRYPIGVAVARQGCGVLRSGAELERESCLGNWPSWPM